MEGPSADLPMDTHEMLIGTACEEAQTALNLSCNCVSTTGGMRMKSRKGITEIICEEAEARCCSLNVP